MQLREDRRRRGPQTRAEISLIHRVWQNLLCVLSSIDLDLQLLGQTPGRPLRVVSTSFIFLPTLSRASATWRAPS